MQCGMEHWMDHIRSILDGALDGARWIKYLRSVKRSINVANIEVSMA